MWKIFGPKGDGQFRMAYNEKLRDLVCRPSSMDRVVKSKRLLWAEHLVRIWWRQEMQTEYWWGNISENGLLCKRGDWNTALRRILRKYATGLRRIRTWSMSCPVSTLVPEVLNRQVLLPYCFKNDYLKIGDMEVISRTPYVEWRLGYITCHPNMFYWYHILNTSETHSHRTYSVREERREFSAI
jgi:hypothetical protein